ncbi:condensin complex subunit 3 [Elysia marginata]|uniref:Condensin complex subunit 3 n=1 Tax=Elysia marginata TaxID=1093978 RepID=A0AAV4G385_9GAST|nr:condensin complex subunit 3 [Elysia marginata]
MADTSPLKELLIECQDTQNQHGLLKTFYELYKNTDNDEFTSEFLSLIRHPMAVYTREPCVEKTIDFLSKAVTYVAAKDNKNQINKDPKTAEIDEQEDDEMHPLLSSLFNFLLDVNSAKERAIRFRVCQLVTHLLRDLGEGAQIDDELYDRIYRCMVQRLRDKCAQVRVHAVLALTRLQDPTETCPIIKAYMILMTKDPNMEVRRIVLTCIAPSTVSLPAILERTRDVKEAVRRSAYSVIAEKVPLRALTIQQRVDIIQSGLGDRSETVKTTCASKLLQSWLRACQGNALELLERLDVQSSVKVCHKALHQLFKTSGILDLVGNFDLIDSKQLIPEEKLSCESSFYWKSVVEYIQSQGHEYEEQLDSVRPNCIEFCTYVKKFSEQLRDCTDMEKSLDLEFIMEQLLQLLAMMDFTDNASRKATEKLLHNLLVSEYVGPSLVSAILPCLEKVHASTDLLINYLAETISEIREPITLVETKLTTEKQITLDKKIAGIRVKVNELRHELSDCIEKQDFERAARIKMSISELDAERSSLLEESQPAVEEVRTHKNDPLTVLKCLTIICELLISVNVKKWSPQLQGLMEDQILPGMINEEAELRNLAVKAIGLCCHIKKNMVMQHLPVLLQDPDLRCVAAEGLSKLILSGRVVSAKLLSHLLLMWFNPLLEDDENLGQILGSFFPLFSFSRSENQQLFEEAFLPTLKTLTRAPTSSPLSEINEVNVANFLIYMTDAQHLVENAKDNTIVKENPCHDSLAVKLCNEVLSHPDSFAVKLWIQALNQLKISPDNLSLHKDLMKMSEKIAMVVTEKPCLKLLEKFRGIVSCLMDAHTESEEEVAEAESAQNEAQSSEDAGKGLRFTSIMAVESVAIKLKLPTFWVTSPLAWFAQAEAQFALRNITQDETKYFHVLAALDTNTATRALSLLTAPPPSNKYGALKEFLISAFGLTDEERASTLLDLVGLGDYKPSELMNNMLSLLGSHTPCFLFKQIFMRQLPDQVRASLATSATSDYRALALEADKLFLAMNQHTASL